MRFISVLALFMIIAIADVKQIHGTFSYPEARKVCEKLGKNWRIMEIWELFELRGQTEKFGKGKLYWSGNTLGEARIEKNIRHESEIFVSDSSIPAYAFYLQDGDITPTPKDVKAHVLCTNQKKVHQLDRQFVKKGAFVIDKKERVIWEPFDKKRDKIKKSYEEAQRWCENLHLLNKDWRLPTLDELFGIVNYNYIKPSLNKGLFGHMHHKYYLTDDEFGEDEVYVVGFAVGSVATGPKSERYYFRCVSDLE